MTSLIRMISKVVDIGWWKAQRLCKVVDEVIKQTKADEEIISPAILNDLLDKVAIVEKFLGLLEQIVPKKLGGVRYNLGEAKKEGLNLKDRRERIEIALDQLNNIAFGTIAEATQSEEAIIDGSDLAQALIPILETMVAVENGVAEGQR